jgi:hypothetical protein
MPVSERIARERQVRHDARMEEAREVVPHGMYCYQWLTKPELVVVDGVPRIKGESRMCPYWKLHGGKRSQENGYCRLMKVGDWTPPGKGGTFLLWDQVKECGVNDACDEDDHAFVVGSPAVEGEEAASSI